jgi:hypothetical protein
LGQVIGLCAANVPCPNCGGDKTVQRAESPNTVLRSPSDQRERCSYRLLCDGKSLGQFLNNHFFLFYENMPAHIALVGGLTPPKNSNALNIFTYIFLQ